MRPGLLLMVLGLVVVSSSCRTRADAKTFRECEDCPAMVIVPAGTAVVGASADDPMHNADETPLWRFRVSLPFAVSRFEITRAEFEAFVRASGVEPGGDCLTDRRRSGDWQIDAATTFRDPGFTQTHDHPVTCVSWHDAQAYIAWLNAHTSGGYRMLTEGEWEYVARSGSVDPKRFPWGNTAAQGCAFANGFDRTALEHYERMDRSGYKLFDPLECVDGYLNTAPTGSHRPNPFGVHDMIGNVSEWVEDCYTPAHTAVTEPRARTSTDPPCSRRVAKGGSWGTLGHNLRIAERFAYAPTHRDDSIGIRVAKDMRPRVHPAR